MDLKEPSSKDPEQDLTELTGLTLTDLLNQIDQVDENSLLEKIISYCNEKDIQPNELGDLLSKSEQFKRVLWFDAVQNNQIQDPLLKDKLKQTNGFDVW